MNEIGKVYNQDLRPLVRVCGAPAWERYVYTIVLGICVVVYWMACVNCMMVACRLQQPSHFVIQSNGELTLTFEYTFISSADVEFAFYYPFSYSDDQALLDSIDARLRRQHLRDVVAPCGCLSVSTLGGPADVDLYYHRELLVKSPDGRRVELLTLTSCLGMLTEREQPLPHLFPELCEPEAVRPRKFAAKPAVCITARVVRTCALVIAPLPCC
jgi:hypothetical protein